MRAFLFIMLSFVLGVGSVSAKDIMAGEKSPNFEKDWENSTQAEDWSVRAFVGRKIFVEERAKPEYMDFTTPDGSVIRRTLPAFDARYEARYKILDVVKGPIEGSTIDFVAYDHYSRPGFPDHEHVLLFVVSHNSEWVHSKYLYYPVQRTTDGDWAICGKAFVHESAADAEKTLADSFEEPIGFIDHIDLPDGIICKTGTRARNLFELQEKTRFIPRRNRVLCNREIGVRDYVVAGTGSGPYADIEKQKHAACMERLNVATLSKGQRR